MEAGQHQRYAVEDFRIDNRLSQFEFDLGHGQRNREIAIVAREYAEFQIAQIARGRGIAGPIRLYLAGAQAIVPGEIKDTCGFALFRDVRTLGDQLVYRTAALARGVDDYVGSQSDWFSVLHAFDAGNMQNAAVFLMRDQPLDTKSAQQLHIGQRLDIAAHRHFQRRAAAGDDG